MEVRQVPSSRFGGAGTAGGPGCALQAVAGRRKCGGETGQGQRLRQCRDSRGARAWAEGRGRSEEGPAREGGGWL